MFAVEPDFFDMFDFKWLAGSPSTSLSDPAFRSVNTGDSRKIFRELEKSDWSIHKYQQICSGKSYRHPGKSSS